MADDTNVVSFRARSDGGAPPPPPPLPQLPAAPAAAVGVADRDAPAMGGGPLGLPGVESMRPPGALLPPPPPLGGGRGGGSGGADGGEFAPPAPADPENPTGRELLQVCMAIVTAMGVAAAQGMWHRARHRQALADQSRAGADKARGKTVGAAHHSGGGSRGASGSKGGGVLAGSRHESGSRSRGSRAGGHGGSGHGSRHGRKTSSGGRHGGPYGGDGAHKARGKGGHKAPKSAKNGRTVHGKLAGGKRRRGVKGGLGDAPCLQTTQRRPKADAKGSGKAQQQDGGRGTKRRSGGEDTKSRTPSARKATWKAPRKSKPGPGGDRALPAGRKRWTRPGPASTSKPSSKSAKPRSMRGKPKQASRRRTWLRWKSSPAWLKGWRTRHKARAAGAGTASMPGSAGGTGARDNRYWEEHTRSAPPPPPPRAEWMRPPPGTDRKVRITVERVDNQPRPRRGEPAVLAGAPAAGSLALPPASAGKPARQGSSATSTTSAPAQTNGTVHVTPYVPAPRTTQYHDAELTIYDVIEADADMAEEILEGVDEARATAAGCERLMTRLEAIHAEIVDLKVPGVLAGMLMKLIDKTLTVKARAEAIAANLPAAAEAIATAGSNAAARHQPLADVTRDMGHVRPAEREYHDE